MKKFFKDFAAFINKGNVMNLAIGIIIGAAFQKIVTSLVNDIIMPVIGVIIGVNVSDSAILLVEATETSEAVYLRYGAFIQTIIDFLIIAFSIFIAISVITRMSKRLDRLKETAKTGVEGLIRVIKNEELQSVKEGDTIEQSCIDGDNVAESDQVNSEEEIEKPSNKDEK